MEKSIIISTNFQFISIFFKYRVAAKKVPLKEGIFKLAITVETGRFGSNINPMGVCINPPPPTIASTKPARKATKHNNKIREMSIIN
jgi:hypothetical protein